MSLPEISCPVCHKRKFTLSVPGRGEQVCPCSKKKRIQFHRYPAYEREMVLSAAADTGFVEGESTCFHHPNRKAVAVCADCGVFICEWCEVKEKGASLCLSCFAKRQTNDFQAEPSKAGMKRLVYDDLALALALLPMLFVWATLLTAPATLFVVIRYWKKHPCSVVPRTRFRFILAAVIAVLQIVGWGFVLAAMLENSI